MATQDERLAAIAAAAADMLRQTPYHVVRAGDVAAAVRLPGETGRSAVWLYNEVRNRRVLVALAAAHAWREFTGRAQWSAPGPACSVTEARSAMVTALGVIVAFHRGEQTLMTQVGYGIGDISTAEKRQLAAGADLATPNWPDSPWGQVAGAAWHGRCEVFTDFLHPVLRDCAQSVTYLAEQDTAESAARLSDIAFRTCLADREGPVDLIARGLAALWFERDLTRFAGSLARDLESSETAMAAVARRGTDRRAEASACAVLVRVLLEAGTLHERGIREARRAVSLWEDLVMGAGAAVSGFSGHDVARLSDAASHLGLAAARYGDFGAAARAWELSHRVAAQSTERDRSRMARADNNLAALAAATGHAQRADRLITAVWHTRLGLLASQSENPATWRRLTVTERTRAEITRINGQVVEGVRQASALLTDRRARRADPAHADVADARLVMGQALLSAGQPAAARRHLEEAADVRHGRFLATSYRIQEGLIWLAKTALVLERPGTVLDLLAGQTAESDWFRDRVSFRLAFTARRLLAVARGQLGATEEAEAALKASREELRGRPLGGGLDPLAADFDRSLAELALAGADAPRAGLERAADTLARLARAETQDDVRPPLPAHGWTLVLLGRAASRLGDLDRAKECFGSVTGLAAAGLDAHHPVILTAHYDEAVRCADTGNTRRAATLLTPLLDRATLDHGLPALSEGHPLLTRARTLAERLGVSVPDTMSGLYEASMDIDA